MGKLESTRGNGPDYLDTWTYMKEIEQMYRVSVRMRTEPGTKREMGAFKVSMEGSWPDLTTETGVMVVGVCQWFPTPTGRDWWSLALALCVRLDYELARRRFVQDSIWPEA